MRDAVLSIGSIFAGSYEILARVGEGSFGRVYKGRQRSTGQTVAIKILRLRQGEAAREVENQIARFRREMRLCAELSHPNIVRLIDAGESEDGTLYAVFEYAPGATLREVLASEGSLGWGPARHLMTQVLDALACAHARGIVHRDLKPENLMVTQTGAQRNALVLDFGLGGLAREVQDWSLPGLTATREILGTPSYAAPEQLRGEPVSTRSDLYAWGLILLECLTGELALRGQSLHEIIVKQLSLEPVPIPVSIRNGRLRRLLQRVTEKRVERRDVTIEALLQTLRMIDAEEGHAPRGLPGAAAGAAGAAEGERRQLTVLLCDLVGSTELSARLDPEEFRDVVQAYHRSAEEVVGRFGGHVGRFLGDGVLVYFGWPTAHEDDAERAVRAGLSLLGAIGTLNERLAPGVRLAVRVGMHTGPVVIGEDVFGETPNVAARVQQLAAADTVVITADTHRLVAGLFVVEECGPHTLRGVPEPVALYRVVQPSGVRSRFHARVTRGLTPLVGREHERQLLSERWQRTREGEGQVVLITGEPGIGKSRLAEALREELAAAPHTRIECQGAPVFQNTAFHPVEDMLRQGFAWRGDESATERLQGLERALELAGLRLPEAVPLVAPLLSLPVPEQYPPLLTSPEQQRRKLLATLAAWLFETARVQPILLVVEDLHWVDPSTLELLGLLVAQGATAPLLLLFTARPEFAAPWPARAHHAQLTLNRLSRHEARAMVARVAGETPLPADTVETLVRRTDGVPLFIEELTRLVLQRGAGAGGRDGAAVREIPATLEDSLRARLDQLGPAREVAQVAAVIGREFSYALLQAVLPLRDPDLQAALEALAGEELLYARGLPPEATYLFKHALIQDAAYAALLRSQRRELHGAIARALSERFPATAEAQPEVLAHHYTEAGEAEPAMAAWQRAGERAFGRGALSEAVSHFRRGLAVLATLPESPAHDEQEFRLQLPLGQALTMSQAMASPEAAEAFARARVLGANLGNPAQVVLLLCGLTVSVLYRDGPRAAQPLADQALAAAEQAGLPRLLVWAHHAQALTRGTAGDHAGAREHCRCALALYDEATQLTAPLDNRINVLPLAAILAWHLGHAAEARGLAQEAVELAERAGRPADRAFAETHTAWLHVLLREPAAVREHAERAARAETEGMARSSGTVMILRGWALAEEGQTQEGLAAVRAGLERVRALGQQLNLEFHLDLLADAHACAGNVAEALTVLADAEGAVPGEEMWRADTLRRRAELLARRGAPPDEVDAIFRASLEVAHRQGAKAYELRTATRYAAWLRAHGRAAEGRELLAPLYASFTEGFDTRDLIEARALLEELA